VASLLQLDADYQAAANPLKDAVMDGKISLNYADLASRSNRLAQCLIQHGVTKGEKVLICMRRSVHYIEAILGVLKAEAVYIPIESRTPASRLKQILDDCKPRIIISDSETAQMMIEKSEKLGLPQLIILGGPLGSFQTRSGIALITLNQAPPNDLDSLNYRNAEDDLACIFYTSGSTGTPKGVMLSHRNIDEYIKWAVKRFDISNTDRILCTAPFYFDMSLFDVYCSLKAGATLCIASERELLFPSRLIDFAEANEVTIWKGISSLLMYLAQTGSITSDRLPSLRTIFFGGETLHAKYLIEWMRKFPDKTFYNVYGPTEATGISMYYHVPQIPVTPDERIPIGKPCENTEVFLLDENRQLVPLGEIGEICIKSVCLAQGYLNDPEKKNQVFVDNPLNPGRGDRIYLTGDYGRLRPDGNYELSGRRDNQVKFLGYRIELSDIENALVSITGVRDAAAILARSDRSALPELVAYVETDKDFALPVILAETKNRLPHYMVPKRLFQIARLPRTDRGKLNRQALLDYHEQQSSLK
jgi:amino acid adenylation domain-containing protein